MKKPVAGNLVALNWAVLDTKERDILWKEWHDLVGIITECVGIRCRVLWQTGESTLPERSILEVLA